MTELSTESHSLPNSNQTSYSSKWMIDLFSGLGKVLNQVGIAGFLVISFIVFIYFFADKSHKDEIIDDWLLFKGGNTQCYLIVFILVILLFAQQFHYKRVIVMKDERIKELSTKKTNNYSQKLGINLSSSLKKNKP